MDSGFSPLEKQIFIEHVNDHKTSDICHMLGGGDGVGRGNKQPQQRVSSSQAGQTIFSDLKPEQVNKVNIFLTEFL